MGKSQHTLYIDDKLWERLNEVAQREGRRRQDLIQMVLRSHVNASDDADSIQDAVHDLELVIARVKRLTTQQTVDGAIGEPTVIDPETEAVMESLVEPQQSEGDWSAADRNRFHNRFNRLPVVESPWPLLVQLRYIPKSSPV